MKICCVKELANIRKKCIHVFFSIHQRHSSLSTVTNDPFYIHFPTKFSFLIILYYSISSFIQIPFSFSSSHKFISILITTCMFSFFEITNHFSLWNKLEMELEACCDVEVDINNGEETFLINKNILTTLWRKFSNLFGNLVGEQVRFKVIFNDFPGGSHDFELVAWLCYYYSTSSSMSMELLSTTNVALLCSAADFL
ncbi:hypothetical protein HN51_017255 [Arachis hypogaea]